MKSFMDSESQPVIPHLIEEVPNFKGFVEGYLCIGGDALEGHTNAQQFKFYKDSGGWPLMQYKLLCTDNDWLPKEGGGIRLWKECVDGRPKVPTGDPLPLIPQEMRCYDEVCKGLDGFINLWGTMANEDTSREFRRKNEPLSFYWKGVKTALTTPVPSQETLQNGFWPTSRYAPEMEDQFMDDGTMREEYAEDAPFVGRRRDRPLPSFRVGRDVYAGYFVAVRPADDCRLEPNASSAFYQITPIVLFSIVYQVELQDSGVTIPQSIMAIESRPPRKWLNIVLDINGILCHCVDKSTARRQRHVNSTNQNEFSSTIPTIIGPKGVYTRPGLHDFLFALSGLAAHLVIWSSMKRSTVEHIVGFMFNNLPPPFEILGQESCSKIEISPGKFLTSPNSSKEIFLKSLPDRLFAVSNGSVQFSRDNTLLIDDSPEKSICNETGNSIFLDSWTRNSQNDHFLMEVLHPWLYRLHLECRPEELREYVDRNRIGCPPLAATSALLKHILRGMGVSSRNFGTNFDVKGVPGVVVPHYS